MKQFSKIIWLLFACITSCTRPGTAYITLGGKIADNSRYVTHSDGQGLLETPYVATAHPAIRRPVG